MNPNVNKLAKQMLVLGSFICIASCGEAEPSKSQIPISRPIDTSTESESDVNPTKKLPGISDFENWRSDDPQKIKIIDNATKGQNSDIDADQISLAPGLGLIRTHHKSKISANDTVSVKLWLWAKQPETLTLTLVRACSETTPELFTDTLQIKTTPQEFQVSNKFFTDHDCFWTRLRGTREDQEVYAWGYRAFINDKELK